MVMALLLQIPLQAALAWHVYKDNCPFWWGFVIGAAGALVGMTGAACVFLIEGVRRTAPAAGSERM